MARLVDKTFGKLFDSSELEPIADARNQVNNLFGSAFNQARLGERINAGGLASFRPEGGPPTVTANEGRRDLVQGISDSFGALSNDIATLKAQVRPGFGRLTDAGIAAIDRGRRRAVGDLRENLARRRISGSSFAVNALGNVEAEFAAKEREFRAEAFLEELQLSVGLAKEQAAAQQQKFQTVLDEANLEADVALQLSSRASDIFASLASAQASALSTLAALESQALGAGNAAVGSLIKDAVNIALDIGSEADVDEAIDQIKSILGIGPTAVSAGETAANAAAKFGASGGGVSAGETAANAAAKFGAAGIGGTPAVSAGQTAANAAAKFGASAGIEGSTIGTGVATPGLGAALGATALGIGGVLGLGALNASLPDFPQPTRRSDGTAFIDLGGERLELSNERRITIKDRGGRGDTEETTTVWDTEDGRIYDPKRGRVFKDEVALKHDIELRRGGGRGSGGAKSREEILNFQPLAERGR